MRTVVIVLLGPPGSGKSSVGAELGELGFRWREWEPELLVRWGSRDRFVERKTDALAWLDASRLAFIEEGPGCAVIESTGLSDGAFLDGLSRHCVFVARLDVTEDAALERIGRRPAGRHLSDDLEANRRAWRAFDEHVRPFRRAQVVIPTDVVSPKEAAVRIARAFRAFESEQA